MSTPSSQPRSTVQFFYDVVCPYAYLGSTQVRRIADAAGARLVHRPLLLGGVLNAVNADQKPAPLPEARVRYGGIDLQRFATWRGVTLRFPLGHPRRSVEAMRLLSAAELSRPEALEPLTDALYRAYWVEGRDIADRAVLAELGAAHGVPVEQIDRDEVKARLRATTEEAVREGVFGVPVFLVDGPGGRHFVFGQDRLHFLEQALRGHLGERFTAPVQRVPPRAAPSGREVVFLFDFSSPFTYLASTQIERVAAEQGARVVFRPVLLGAIFKEIGNPIVPIQAMNPPKRAWYARDLHDWAAHWGVPFRFASRFPMMTVTPLRMVLAAAERDRPALAKALFHAYWVDDRDIADKGVLAGIADGVGLDGNALVERTADPAIKQELIDNTSSAIRAGVFGLPSFLVGEELFFGQDRLDFVSRALAG